MLGMLRVTVTPWIVVAKAIHDLISYTGSGNLDGRFN